MTVCLAALCKEDDTPRVVVAADRMVTLGTFIEFEHTMPKMIESTPHAIAMIAGDTLVGTRLSQEVAGALAGSNASILEIAQQFAARYEATRNAKIEQQVLAPRGLNWSSFYGGHATFNGQIILMIDQLMTQFNLGVEVLIGGLDDSGGHIYTVQNPGRPEYLNDIIGYAAVGSGAIHAIQSMIGFRHSPDADYHPTVFRAYASKRRAEVAPGVGTDTDVAVIGPDGTHWLTAEELAKLADIYNEFENATSAALDKQLADFKLGEVPNEPTVAAER